MSKDQTERLKGIADRVLLVELIHQACLFLDGGGTPKQWADLFTEEGVWRYWSADGTLTEESKGTEKLIEKAESTAAKYPNFKLKHHVVNVVADLDGDQATVRSYYFTVVRQDDGGLLVRTSGRYEDRCSRDGDGTWRIAERQVRLDIGARRSS